MFNVRNSSECLVRRRCLYEESFCSQLNCQREMHYKLTKILNTYEKNPFPQKFHFRTLNLRKVLIFLNFHFKMKMILVHFIYLLFFLRALAALTIKIKRHPISINPILNTLSRNKKSSPLERKKCKKNKRKLFTSEKKSHPIKKLIS